MLERGKVSGLPTRGLCIQGFLAGVVLTQPVTLAATTAVLFADVLIAAVR